MSPVPTTEIIDTFLRNAVVVYRSTEQADPARWQHAKDCLDTYADVSRWSIYTAAVCGDVEAVAYWIEQDPSLVSTPGGAHQWEPLMYAAYGRLEGADTLGVAGLLLEAGASPNAFELVDGHYYFTALTGVFGHGEAGIERQPAHPDCEIFARRLLDAGANPNDSQAAYNRIFTPDNLCLTLLLEYGLSSEHQNNWTLDDGQPHPQKTLQYQLDYAIERGFQARVQLLLDADMNINYASNGVSPWKRAMLAGRTDIAVTLEHKGSVKERLSTDEQLVHRVLTHDAAGARALITEHPGLVERVKELHPDIAEKAVLLEGVAAVSLVLELGLEPAMHRGHTAAHKAAYSGRVDVLKVMHAAGYDLTQRDHHYRVPPVGWALHAGEAEAVRFLDRCDMDPFTAAARNNVQRLKSQIDRRPALLTMTFGEFLIECGHTDIDELPQAAATLLDFALGTNSTQAVHYLTELGAVKRDGQA